MNAASLLDLELCGRLCLTFAHSLWQAALLGAIAFVASQMLRRHSAQLNYAVQVAALVACVVALPLTFAVLPKSAPETNAEDPALVAAIPSVGTDLSPVTVLAANTDNPHEQIAARGDRLSAAGPGFAWNRAAGWLVVGYLAGVVAMLVRLARSVASAERLRRGAQVLSDGPVVFAVRRLASEWRVRVVPALARAETIVVPTLVGLLRPTIVLPAAVLTGLTQAELELILAHELAHVRRGDIWVNLFQRLIEAALFFNPAVWFLSRRIDALREYCCDELACGELQQVDVSSTTARLDYANALVRVAEIARPMLAGQHDLAALAASGRSPSELRRRVARLLGEPMSEPLRLSRGALLLGVVLLGLICGPLLIARRAQAIEEPKADEAKAREALVAQTVAANEMKPTLGTASFSSGTKVIVLALGMHKKATDKEGTEQWWNARGESLPNVFAWSDKNNVASAEKKWRRLLFRIKGLPEGAAATWDIVGAQASAGGTVRPAEWKLGEQAALSPDANVAKDPNNVHAVYFGVADDRKTVDLRVRLAAGPWVTKETLDLGSIAIGGADNKSIVSSGAIAQDGGTLVVVSHNYFDQEFRLVAIDKDQKLHDTAGRGGWSAGNIYQCKALFAGLTSEKIDHFEFQVRDYERVEVKGLPLDPVDATGKPAIIGKDLCRIDPDEDCQFDVTEDKLRIVVPGSWHDLTYTDDYTKLNAPRVLRISNEKNAAPAIKTYSGDFVAEMQIEPFTLPSEKSSGGAHSFASAGLLIWQDSRNFIRIDRATVGGLPFVWVERFQDGKSVSQEGLDLEDAKNVWLRATRAGDKFTIETSPDSKDWARVAVVEATLTQPLQLGVSAINTSAAELSVNVLGLHVSQAAK